MFARFSYIEFRRKQGKRYALEGYGRSSPTSCGFSSVRLVDVGLAAKWIGIAALAACWLVVVNGMWMSPRRAKRNCRYLGVRCVRFAMHHI